MKQVTATTAMMTAMCMQTQCMCWACCALRSDTISLSKAKHMAASMLRTTCA